MSNVKEMLKFTLAIDNNKKAFIFASLLTNRPTATTIN
jgi:hypothetical protein